MFSSNPPLPSAPAYMESNPGSALISSKILHKFTAINIVVSPYPSKLLHVNIPSLSFMSPATVDLSVSYFRLSTMGARAFSNSVPRLWNSLPPDIRNINTIFLKLTSKLTWYVFYGRGRLSTLRLILFNADIVIPGANNSGEVQARISAGESIHIIRGSKGTSSLFLHYF